MNIATVADLPELHFKITRPTRADMRVTVFTDDRIAPKAASRECREHGLASINAILNVLVGRD